MATNTDPSEHGRRLAADLQAIRADRTLSDHGRRVKIGEAWVKAREAFDREAAATQEKAAAAVRTAEQRLFGTGGLGGDIATNAVSARDALDRATNLKKPGEALDAMDRALAVGDEILARAVLRVAWERAGEATPAWAEPVDRYLAAHPDRRPVADELVMAQRDASPSRTGALVDRMGVSKPSELAGIPDVPSWLQAQKSTAAP